MTRSLGIITTLDVGGRTNNREHHLIRHLGERYDRVIVVYRRRGRPDAFLREALGSGRTIERVGKITYVAVSPRLNLPEGAVRGRTTAAPSAGPLRRSIGAALDAFGVLRDVATISALTAAAREAFRDQGAVTVEALGPWAACAAEALRAQGVIGPYAYVDRDFEPGFVSSALRRRWIAATERRAASRADLVLSIGGRLAARHAAAAGDRLRVSPTGVAFERFSARPRSHPAPRLAYVGEVAPWSCIDLALEALALLRPRHPEAALSVLGPALPDYRDHLLGRAAELGVADAFDWPGQGSQADVARLLDAAAIGMAVFQPQPLRIHAAPLKLLEYMASGLPSLCTPGTEAGDLVASSGAGLLTAPDPAGIAAGVEAMLADPDAYAEMSRRGIEVARRHDWPVVLGREADLLAGLDARRGAPLPAPAGAAAPC
ncbi:MAG TPA: glycosyltransferase family 4 protein [Amaricoccus sp.]|nr:glycosyltransferase family 4 protein [Amaricoccus sp.]